MIDYWPFYLRECRSPIITVKENPDGRNNQEIWNIVGCQQEVFNLATAYYQYADWVRTEEEDDWRGKLASAVEILETHTYDRFEREWMKPSEELRITPKFSLGLESTLVDCGATWTPEQDLFN